MAMSVWRDGRIGEDNQQLASAIKNICQVRETLEGFRKVTRPDGSIEVISPKENKGYRILQVVDFDTQGESAVMTKIEKDYVAQGKQVTIFTSYVFDCAVISWRSAA
jgi:hypothetical protein